MNKNWLHPVWWEAPIIPAHARSPRPPKIESIVRDGNHLLWMGDMWVLIDGPWLEQLNRYITPGGGYSPIRIMYMNPAQSRSVRYGKVEYFEKVEYFVAEWRKTEWSNGRKVYTGYYMDDGRSPPINLCQSEKTWLAQGFTFYPPVGFFK